MSLPSNGGLVEVASPEDDEHHVQRFRLGLHECYPLSNAIVEKSEVILAKYSNFEQFEVTVDTSIGK